LVEPAVADEEGKLPDADLVGLVLTIAPETDELTELATDALETELEGP
jgi:hypothetical protein